MSQIQTVRDPEHPWQAEDFETVFPRFTRDTDLDVREQAASTVRWNASADRAVQSLRAAAGLFQVWTAISMSQHGMRSGHFENGEQVGEWTTYDRHANAVKVRTMKPTAAKAKSSKTKR